MLKKTKEMELIDKINQLEYENTQLRDSLIDANCKIHEFEKKDSEMDKLNEEIYQSFVKSDMGKMISRMIKNEIDEYDFNKTCPSI